MYYYEYDKTVDDDFPWIVYNPDGVESIACNDEDEAKSYVSMFNAGS
jgi:hypothetical protein